MEKQTKKLEKKKEAVGDSALDRTQVRSQTSMFLRLELIMFASTEAQDGPGGGEAEKHQPGPDDGQNEVNDGHRVRFHLPSVNV